MIKMKGDALGFHYECRGVFIIKLVTPEPGNNSGREQGVTVAYQVTAKLQCFHSSENIRSYNPECLTGLLQETHGMMAGNGRYTIECLQTYR